MRILVVQLQVVVNDSKTEKQRNRKLVEYVSPIGVNRGNIRNTLRMSSSLVCTHQISIHSYRQQR